VKQILAEVNASQKHLQYLAKKSFFETQPLYDGNKYAE